MRNIKLNKEEKTILKDFETGKLKSIRDAEEKVKSYSEYADYTLRKSRNINIRLSERDLHKIKAIAAEKGVPYQTLISSLVHQYSKQRSKE